MDGKGYRDVIAVLHMLATAVLMLLTTELIGIARALLAERIGRQ